MVSSFFFPYFFLFNLLVPFFSLSDAYDCSFRVFYFYYKPKISLILFLIFTLFSFVLLPLTCHLGYFLVNYFCSCSSFLVLFYCMLFFAISRIFYVFKYHDYDWFKHKSVWLQDYNGKNLFLVISYNNKGLSNWFYINKEMKIKEKRVVTSVKFFFS